MSIHKQILYEILCDGIQSRRLAICPWTNRPWEQSVDYGMIDFLVRSILFRDPVKDCLIIGDEREWEGFPREKSLRLSRIPGVGLPIGDLTSQLFSNVFLNPLDQFVKRELRCRHYGRYVDDFYIIHPDRCFLEMLIPVIAAFLEEKLHLRVHPSKIRLTRVDQGVRFLGAVIKPFRMYVSNRTVRSFHAKMHLWERRCENHKLSDAEVDLLVQVINSYTGYLSHFRTSRLKKQAFSSSPLNRYVVFSGGWRKCEARRRPRMIIPLEHDPAIFDRRLPVFDLNSAGTHNADSWECSVYH